MTQSLITRVEVERVDKHERVRVFQGDVDVGVLLVPCGDGEPIAKRLMAGRCERVATGSGFVLSAATATFGGGLVAVGLAMRRAREAAGMTLADLAAAYGRTDGVFIDALAGIEAGVGAPPDALLRFYERRFRLDYTEAKRILASP